MSSAAIVTTYEFPYVPQVWIGRPDELGDLQDKVRLGHLPRAVPYATFSQKYPDICFVNLELPRDRGLVSTLGIRERPSTVIFSSGVEIESFSEIDEITLDAEISYHLTKTQEVPPWKCRSALKSGDVAPEFSRTAIDGTTVDLAAFRGQVVVIDFWASWCKPCVDNLVELQQLCDDVAPRGVVFIGVMRERGADPKAAKEAAAATTYKHIVDDGSLFKLYQVPGIPHTYVIDQSGRIALRTFPTKPNLKSIINELLR